MVFQTERAQGVFTTDEMLKRRMNLQGQVVSPNAVDARTHQMMVSNAERLDNLSYDDFVKGMKYSALDVVYPADIN